MISPAALVSLALLLAPPPAPTFDLLLRGGTVVDGSGAPAFRADVGIRDGRIVRVGDLKEASAKRTIDATGHVVAPGFIDVHTHADDLANKARAENFVRMGVTTLVAGNCGSSALDVAKAFEEIGKAGVAVNFATLLGHGTVREAVMGRERRAPTPAEMAKMKALVAKAMEDGAAGLSTGLQYVPGVYAEPGEIVELARVACRAGGVYASHMRNEGTEIEGAVAETIDAGEKAGCPVQISHLKIDSPSRWGASAQALALIDSARGRGVDVQADQYAYTAAASSLSIRFPDWALEGGEERTRQRLDDEETWRRIREEMKDLLAARGFTDLSFAVVASYPSDPTLVGLTMKQVGERLLGDGSADAQLEAARRMLRAGGAGMVYHLMADGDVERILRHPWVGIASDGAVVEPGSGRPHPRASGNNARVLAVYVREKKVIGLEEAVRKMTSLPAARFRLAGRGLVKEGHAADIVVFDPAAVRDDATFEAPLAFARGIPAVIVNGVPVVDGSVHTGARPGQVLRPGSR
ncbi:MAG TPA: D-aminoacylase [Thermoanaerobaculia bacterium]|nr:D-aminoacylase [Thermoanaerobaculia bacterium]